MDWLIYVLSFYELRWTIWCSGSRLLCKPQNQTQSTESSIQFLCSFIANFQKTPKMLKPWILLYKEKNPMCLELPLIFLLLYYWLKHEFVQIYHSVVFTLFPFIYLQLFQRLCFALCFFFCLCNGGHLSFTCGQDVWKQDVFFTNLTCYFKVWNSMCFNPIQMWSLVLACDFAHELMQWVPMHPLFSPKQITLSSWMSKNFGHPCKSLYSGIPITLLAIGV